MYGERDCVANAVESLRNDLVEEIPISNCGMFCPSFVFRTNRRGSRFAGIVACDIRTACGNAHLEMLLCGNGEHQSKGRGVSALRPYFYGLISLGFFLFGLKCN